MKILLRKGSHAENDQQTLVVFFSKMAKDQKKPTWPKIDREVQALIQDAIEDKAFTGDKKDSLFLRGVKVAGFKHVLALGLGSHKEPEQARHAAALLLQCLKSQKVGSAFVNMDSLFKNLRGGTEAVLQAFAEGLWLTSYDYADLKTKGKDEKKSSELNLTLATSSLSAAMNKAFETARVLTECQNFARRLGDTPGNYMTPEILADEAVKAAKGTRLKVTVWKKDRLEKERFGGLLSVAKGSDAEPRFIIMEYKGAATSKKPVCFVGKGLTFDSGGISIKPSASMEEMKYDMCGGAAVIATMTAIARLKLKINAIGLVPASENMPGPSANKPGDVFIARNGKSVEVFNTDAEGRLILGDALAYASEQKPAVIFDAATLTGAIVVALGNIHTGVFTRDRGLMKKIQTAADTTGELVWSMPLLDFHVEDMRGTHADLCNISSSKGAGSATAAGFLEQFVDEKIPWAHFDIAGTAWNIANRFPYHPKKGASGIIVRTFVELAKAF